MVAFFVGVGVSFFCLGIQSLASGFMIRVAIKLTHGFQKASWGLNFLVMMVVSMITFGAYFMQIGVWAGVLLACGEYGDFDAAYFHSADNFTTLGVGEMPMSSGWRLLAPMEAVNGIVIFGLSTASVFAILMRQAELHHKHRLRGS